MFSRKIFLLIASLIVITNSGCVTTRTVSGTVESDSIQAYQEDPSGEKAPVKAGDKVVIYPKETFSINSKNLTYVQMIVSDIDTTRIKGEVKIDSGDFATLNVNLKSLAGEIVEVKLDDIEVIDLYKNKTQLSETAKSRMFDNHGMPTSDFMLMIIIVLVGIAAGRVF
jgi:hypothetical protein